MQLMYNVNILISVSDLNLDMVSLDDNQVFYK